MRDSPSIHIFFSRNFRQKLFQISASFRIEMSIYSNEEISGNIMNV